MKTDSRRGALSSLILAVSLALAGSLTVLAAKTVGSRVSPALEWTLVFLLLFGVGAVWARICSAYAIRSERIAETLREITGGEELDSSVEALRRSKQQAEMVLANMADGIIAVDSECRITLLNRAAEQIFQEKASRVMGEKLEEVDLHPRVARMAADCVSTGNTFESEIRLAGYPERVIGIRAAPFGGGSSGGDSAMIILYDLSEIRRHEKNQKEFVSNVSHELRTPITAVKVTAEVLLGGAKNDEEVVDRFLNTIVSESDRLSVLIDDLMEIARRDSGIVKTEKVDLNVAEVVERAIVSVLPHAEHANVKVEAKVAADLIGYGDETQMVQLLRNLADNAVKYTPSGGTVEVKAWAADGNLFIAVRDTGIGIPQGEVERIFERFYRVDKARSRRLGGTGLGLAIVKGIVEAHGGDISVETGLGKGSTFSIRLPLRSSVLEA